MCGIENKYIIPQFFKKNIPAVDLQDFINMYTIAVEGWRRGLKLTFCSIPVNNENKLGFSLQSHNKKHFFIGSKGDKVQQEAINICNDISMLRERLGKIGLRLPKGKTFNLESDEQYLYSYSRELDFPIIIKYKKEKMNFIIVDSEEELTKVIQQLKADKFVLKISLEKFIQGKRYKVYVINNKVISIIQIVPLQVVGDGILTIEELIEKKNEQRKRNPIFQSNLIEVNDELKEELSKKGYTLDKVLKFEENLNLSLKSIDEEIINETTKFSEFFNEIVVKISEAIPGLFQYEIDTIVDEKGLLFIIDVDTNPNISSHLFPLNGNNVDLPEVIIDEYFPETKGNKQVNFHFDIIKIIEVLQQGLVNEIKVNDVIGSDDKINKYFEAYGDVNTRKFNDWLLDITFELKLNGYAKTLESGVKSIIVYGEEKKVKEFNDILEKNVPLMENVRYYDGKMETTSLVGFHIID